MVAYIRSDLDFILAQIKIAEKHAAYIANPIDPNAAPLYGVGAAGQVGSVPTYTLSIGPAHRRWPLQQPAARPGKVGRRGPAVPRTAGSDLPAGRKRTRRISCRPGRPPYRRPMHHPTTPARWSSTSSLRTISNLIVDQTLGNPAAIMKGLEIGGVVDARPGQRCPGAGHLRRLQARVGRRVPGPRGDAERQGGGECAQRRRRIAPRPAPPNRPRSTPWPPRRRRTTLTLADLEVARAVRDAALEPFGIAMDGDNVQIPNVSPDVGLSAPFNSWFTLFGQFFDHGLDLVNKGGSGTGVRPTAAGRSAVCARAARPTSWC